MREQNNKVPAIRFEGFSGEWEEKELREVCDEFQSGKFIKAQAIKVEGKYPVYGGNGLRGYSDSFNYDGTYALIGRQGALCGNMSVSLSTLLPLEAITIVILLFYFTYWGL